MIEQLSLNTLKYFYYVATHGSVTVAAQKLFVTQSAVSKQLKNLEQSLGIVLFDRVNKTLILTQNGEALLSCCQQVFTQLDNCLLTLKTPNVFTQQLVVSCEPTLAMKWLIPRLATFNQLQSGVDIVLLTSGGQVDFQASNVDIALRRNDFAWGGGIVHEKMADEYVVAVRSPNHQPSKRLLLSSSRPQLWQQLTHSKLLGDELLTYETVVLDHFYLCIEGALAGLGTAVVSSYMVEQELNNYLLQKVQPPIADSSSYHVLSATPFFEDDRKMIFKTWLKHEMQKSMQLFLSDNDSQNGCNDTACF